MERFLSLIFIWLFYLIHFVLTRNRNSVGLIRNLPLIYTPIGTLRAVISTSRLSGRANWQAVKLQKILTERRIDLQILRGVSVLCVVMFHTKPQSFPNGYLGVDAFFVISGFVLAPKILDIFVNKDSVSSGFRSFLESRYRRLMPALLFMIISISPLIFLIGPLDDHFKFFLQSCAAIVGLANFTAVNFSGDYFSPNPNPLLHTWSLSAEEQMYLLVPLCLYFISKRTLLGTLKIQLFLLTVIFLSLLLYFEIPNMLFPSTDTFIPFHSKFSYYSPFSRIWQFASGIVLFTFIAGQKQPKLKVRKKIGNLFLVLLILLLSSSIGVGDKFKGLFVVVCVLSIILCGAYSKRLKYVFLPFSWLGDRSYSVYLFHFPLIYLARFSPIFGDHSSPKRLYLIYALALTLVLSEFSYRFVERILQKNYSRNSNSRLRHKTFGVRFVLITFSISFGFGISANNNYWGLNSDIPKPVVAWELHPECPPMSKRKSPCFYGSVEDPKILLIGDSQAAQISEVYIESAKDRGFNPGVWTLATCEFVLSPKDTQQDSECLTHNRRIFSWINLNKPELVMVAQYIKPDSRHQLLANAILNLSQIGVRTILIENIPIFPDGDLYMKNSTQLELMFGLSYNPPKAFPRTEMLQNFASASDVVSKIVKSNGIDTINLTDLFCDFEVCSRFASGRWLYWDNHHLSVHGANLIRGRLLKTFDLVN